MAAKKDARLLQAELFDGARRSYCLSLIYTLKINEILNNSNEFMSTEEICNKITEKKIHAKYLQRIMQYLASFGVFEEKLSGNSVVFKTTEFLKLPDVLHLHYLFPIQARLMELLEGKSDGKTFFEHVHGYGVWELISKEPINSNFMQYMSTFTSEMVPVFPSLIKEIEKEGKGNAVIMDVGGSQGDIMKVFHENFPSMKCINFDLPTVITAVTPIEGVKMVAGDMFKVETLPKCDIIFTKNILHDWSDEKCIQILKNFYTVIADDGLLLSVNLHINDPGVIDSNTWINRSLDVTMMEVFSTACERSLIEYKQLHEKAGFKVKRYVVLGPDSRPNALLICEKIL